MASTSRFVFHVFVSAFWTVLTFALMALYMATGWRMD